MKYMIYLETKKRTFDNDLEAQGDPDPFIEEIVDFDVRCHEDPHAICRAYYTEIKLKLRELYSETESLYVVEDSHMEFYPDYDRRGIYMEARAYIKIVSSDFSYEIIGRFR